VAESLAGLTRSPSARVPTPAGVNALLIDPNPGRRAATERMLARLGYGIGGSHPDLPAVGHGSPVAGVGVVVIGSTGASDDLADRVRAIRALADVPILVLSEDADSDAIFGAVAAGVNAYVAIGVNGNRIKAGIDLALANHRNTARLQQELGAAREALEARKLVEKAKGIVMRTRRMDEAAAHAALRDMAMKRGLKLVDVARTLVDAQELLG